MSSKRKRLELLRELKDNFLLFAERCLKITDKQANVLPFKLNASQIILHNELEKYKKKHGKVRVVILKGRQMGCSTYIAARFFHKMLFNSHIHTIILGHEGERGSAGNLYKMVNTFYKYLPSVLQPEREKANAQTLRFSNDSEYQVKSANNRETGRSFTAQQVHGSEVAYWKDATTIMSGLLQGVGDQNTEIILESTASGHNEFYDIWIKAEQGDTDFMPIFLPWNIEPAYRKRANYNERLKNFSEEQQGYAKLHNLNLEQMLWRKEKIAFLGEEKFKQEYPISAEEAFISSEHEAFISRKIILTALKRTLTEEEEVYNDSCPFIIGVDPAGDGACHTAVVVRQGSKIIICKNYNTPDTTKIIDIVIFHINKYKPLKVFFDKVGLGKGIFDMLKNLDLKYRSLIVGVNGAEVAISKGPVPYLNRRSEMWDNMKRWIEEEAIMINDKELIEQLGCIGYEYARSKGKLQLTSKKNIKDRKISPDKADALALTFCIPYIKRKLGRNNEPLDRFSHTPVISPDRYSNKSIGWMR